MTQEITTQQNKSLSPAEKFESQLGSYEGHMAALLEARGITIREFMVIALNAVKKTPKLLDCDRKSLIASIFTAAELGLRPNTPAQHCFLIPYGKDVQFQMGYQGLVHLMYQNSRVKKIAAEIVYENDVFEYEKGLLPKLIHVPARENKGNAIAAYAVITLAGADPVYEVMFKEDIFRIKDMSPASKHNSSPWNERNDPMKWMWKKTVLRQASKLVPKSNDVAKATHIDNIIETGGRLTLKEDNGSVEVVEIEGKPVASAEDVATDIFADDNE